MPVPNRYPGRPRPRSVRVRAWARRNPLGIQWSDTFGTSSCSLFEDPVSGLRVTGVAPNGEGGALEILVLEARELRCQVVPDITLFNLSQEEYEACKASLRQIAAQDGISCPIAP